MRLTTRNYGIVVSLKILDLTSRFHYSISKSHYFLQITTWPLNGHVINLQKWRDASLVSSTILANNHTCAAWEPHLLKRQQLNTTACTTMLVCSLAIATYTSQDFLGQTQDFLPIKSRFLGCLGWQAWC